MKLSGNTILITGGGTGIGRGLAEAFHKLGNHVIIAGRRKQPLDETIAANSGMKAYTFDVEDPAGILTFAAQVSAENPTLNVLINNAGIMKTEKLIVGNVTAAESIITTNLLGPIRLTAALQPALQKQDYSAIMNVTSGLAFVPLSPTPTYSATKAAMHSYTESLRFQLRHSKTEVLELAPPYVATDLMSGASDPRAMPLNDFIAEVMKILTTEPTATEICVERVKQLRFAAASGHYDAVFKGMNEAMADLV